ncbi:MAG: glycosyltransferase, partial [Myxococcales bacterium]
MSPRVLHVVPSFYPATRYGGPIFTVLRLCQALGRAGVEVDVLTTDADGPEALDVPTGQFVEVEGVRVRYCRRDLPFDYASSTELMSFLRARVRDYDLVHVTSTFSHPSHVAGERARTAGVPFLVSPRGSLQP